MIEKQRQYKKFQKNLKQAITNVEKYYSAITDLKKQTISHTPPRPKLIRRQKVRTENTVHDQPIKTNSQQLNYINHTPRHTPTGKISNQAKTHHNNNCEVQSFKMEESFSNKKNTVKKEYLDHDQICRSINLSKDEIFLKQTKKEAENHIKQYDKLRQTQQQSSQIKRSGNGVLTLEEGWLYKGQYSQGLFHGFGELYHKNSLVYSGNFQFGYFQGYGKLKYHQDLDYLLPIDKIVRTVNKISAPADTLHLQQNSPQPQWTAYFGQFLRGNISGYGQLWLSNGSKIASKWQRGRCVSKHSVVTSSRKVE